MGIQDGQVGCLYKAALWEAGGIHNLEHTSAHSVACMPLHSCPRSHGVHMGYTLTPAHPKGVATPRRKKPSPRSVGHGEGQEGGKAHPSSSSDPQKLGEWRRPWAERPWAEPLLQTVPPGVCARDQGQGHS